MTPQNAQTPLLTRLDPGSLDAETDLRGILEDAELIDGTPPVSDQAVLAAKQSKRELYGIRGDTRAFDGLGILGEGELDLVIHPDARGRGLGTAALTEMLAAKDPEASRELRAWAHGENPAATALLAGAGFAPIRTLFRLALPPADLPAAIAGARPMPEGFRMTPFEPGNKAHADEWVRVNAAAFASHPEQGAVTLEDFRALTREPWFDVNDLRLAFDGDDRLAGYAWVKTSGAEPSGAEPSGAESSGARTSTTETELYVLGVDPGYAGRGLGAGLFGESLRQMATHSPDRITLYVDGDNERARALYDRAGFVTDAISTQWHRI